MKKYLISKEGNFYKANLHCHTNLSDAALTPEEVKKVYQELGYSIVAYTEHNIFIPHNDLTDDTFLALNGFELDVSDENGKPWNQRKTCHIGYIALDKDNVIQPMWSENYLYIKNTSSNKHLVQYDETLPPYVRTYGSEGVSDMMQIGRDSGFFVTYNHPTWSLEKYPDYVGYDGMHALEMFNGGAIQGGYDDYNPRVYDDLLGVGKRIYCVAGDDNHNLSEPNSRTWDSGLAFTMIKASNLEYKSVADALVDGNFYCSEGPSIYELWIEDDTIHIECSDADRVICNYQTRKVGVAYAENGKPVTSADFKFEKQDGYFRITIIDAAGKRACTNAYFIEEE